MRMTFAISVCTCVALLVRTAASLSDAVDRERSAGCGGNTHEVKLNVIERSLTMTCMMLWGSVAGVARGYRSAPRPGVYPNMAAELWFQAMDQRSRRRQQYEQAHDNERIQQIETLGRMRARNGRSRRDEVMRKYLESRRSRARHCSIERGELTQLAPSEQQITRSRRERLAT